MASRFSYSRHTSWEILREADRQWLAHIGRYERQDTNTWTFTRLVDDLYGFGLNVRAFTEDRHRRRGTDYSDAAYYPRLHFSIRTRAGWPAYALAGDQWDAKSDGAVYNPPWEVSDSGPTYPSLRRVDDGRTVRPFAQWSHSGAIVLCQGPAMNRVLPCRPILLGFLINTVFYAAVLCLLICGPFALRRLIRRRRGLCPGCGYPGGESDVCTECGHTLPGRLEATT